MTLRIAEDASDEKLLSDIDKFGWHMVAIEEDATGPEYIFTVGLFYTFEHPEIVIMGLPRDIMCQFLEDIVSLIRTGKKYSNLFRDTDLASFPITFRNVNPEKYKEYLGYATWFYKPLSAPFPVLQFVWPDKSGLFPWETDYDSRFLTRQHLLYKTDS